MIEDSTHGRLLVIDPTDDDTSPGSVPHAILGHRALLVDGPRGALVTVPGARPEDHRLEQWLTVTIGTTGRSASLANGDGGEPAALYRTGLRSEGVTWRTPLSARSASSGSVPTFESFEIVEETSEGAADRTGHVDRRLPRRRLRRQVPTAVRPRRRRLPRVSLRRRSARWYMTSLASCGPRST